MSLESAIASLIDAVNANTAALNGKDRPQPAAAAAPGAKPAKGANKGTAAPVAETPKPPSAKEVADAVMEIANTVNRDAAKKILSDHGVEKVSGLKAEQFASVLAACAATKKPKAAAVPESNDSLI